MMASLDELQLQILRLMRDATAAGVITWGQSDTDKEWFYTESGPIQSYIHFKWPSYNGDVGSDRDFVEVNGAGRFMIGTQGWTLALEILAAGSEDWARHVAALREQFQRQLSLLTGAIKKSNA
jgi:hypothetical protein